MNRFRLLICSSLLLLWLQALTAGVLMVSTQESFQGSQQQPTTTKLRVESDRVRIEMDGTERSDVMIFRGDRQVMWIIDHKAKVYREMTKADIDRLGGRASEIRAMMQEQLKNMPPERRQMVERMMKSKMSGIPTLLKEGTVAIKYFEVGDRVMTNRDIGPGGMRIPMGTMGIFMAHLPEILSTRVDFGPFGIHTVIPEALVMAGFSETQEQGEKTEQFVELGDSVMTTLLGKSAFPILANREVKLLQPLPHRLWQALLGQFTPPPSGSSSAFADLDGARWSRPSW